MKTTLIKFLQTEMNWNPINISFIEKLVVKIIRFLTITMIILLKFA